MSREVDALDHASEPAALVHPPVAHGSPQLDEGRAGLPAPVVALLEATRDVVLFGRDGEGSPVGWPMRTLAVRDGAMVFTTYAASAKVRHLRRDQRVCVLISSSSSEGTSWASISGLARVAHPTPAELDELFGGSSSDERVPTWMAGSVRQRLAEGKRVLLEISSLRCQGVEVARWT